MSILVGNFTKLVASEGVPVAKTLGADFLVIKTIVEASLVLEQRGP